MYYFSGTGNSLYVAKELQKRVQEANLIPIVSLLNKDDELVSKLTPIFLNQYFGVDKQDQWN